jgi:hypothetical protein
MYACYSGEGFGFGRAVCQSAFARHNGEHNFECWNNGSAETMPFSSVHETRMRKKTINQIRVRETIFLFCHQL